MSRDVYSSPLTSPSRNPFNSLKKEEKKCRGPFHREAILAVSDKFRDAFRVVTEIVSSTVQFLLCAIVVVTA